ncbi:MAG: type II toxin-antitoxin system RelE/ParE family toxin [Parasphingorhabdus sp.]
MAKPPAPKIDPTARADLRRIGRETVNRWGEAQKERYLAKITARIKTLAFQPNIGTARDDLDRGVRSAVAGKHLLLYRIIDDRVHILRVVHQNRDLKREIERGRSRDLDIGR